VGESEAPVRAVDPSDTVGDRDVVVGATDVAMGDSVPASAIAVGSIEVGDSEAGPVEVADRDAAGAVGAIDPSKAAGEDVVGATKIAMGESASASATVVGSIEAVVVGEVVRTVGAFDPSEVGGRDAVSVGEMVVNAADVGEDDSINTPTVGEVVVAVRATTVGEVVVAVRATTVGEVVVAVRVATAGDEVQVGHMGELEGASVGQDS
jgi:hypothetical protein